MLSSVGQTGPQASPPPPGRHTWRGQGPGEIPKIYILLSVNHEGFGWAGDQALPSRLIGYRSGGKLPILS